AARSGRRRQPAPRCRRDRARISPPGRRRLYDRASRARRGMGRRVDVKERPLLESIETTTQAPTPVVPRPYVRYVGNAPEAVDAGVIGEIRFSIFIDDRE